MPKYRCAYLPTSVRIFTHKTISPVQTAHIYPQSKKACAYLPTSVRIFTHKRAHIYPQACAYLPTNGHLSTGAHLRLNLFPQVAYNYIPVDLYPHGGSTNQHHQELEAERLPPRLAARWAAAQINRFGCHQTPHHNRTPSTRRVAVVSPRILDKEKERQNQKR